MASGFMTGGAVWRKLDKGESCSGSISMASFLNADLHLPRNVFFVDEPPGSVCSEFMDFLC